VPNGNANDDIAGVDDEGEVVGDDSGDDASAARATRLRFRADDDDVVSWSLVMRAADMSNQPCCWGSFNTPKLN
jgi:hypothetical protein